MRTYDSDNDSDGLLTVCRGSAIARIAGQNVVKHSDVFESSRVPLWVFEEMVSTDAS